MGRRDTTSVGRSTSPRTATASPVRTRAPRPPARRAPAPGTDRAAGPAAVLQLQTLAGNAAVAALLSRQRAAGDARPPPVAQRLAGDCPPAPPPPVGTTPATDPRFTAARRQIAATARTARQHPPAAAEVAAAQGAAPAPLDDKQAQAEAAQTATMAAARPGGFDKAAFIAAVRAAVARHAPPNLEEADRFAASGRSDRIRSDVQGLVGGSKSEAARDVADRTAQPPDPGVAVEKPVTPLAPIPPTPALAPPAPGGVTPAPAPAEQTDLRAGPCETNAMMADSGVTDEQLAESNEPDFTDALAAKRAGEQHSAAAPAEVRAYEADELAAATESARAVGGTGVSAMAGAHETSRSAVDSARAGTVCADHDTRATLNAELRPLFTATKQDVERILSDLDDKIGRRFDDGEREARAAFTADHQARLARYKAERYSGPTGWTRWLADLPGLPAEANQIYQHSRRVYEQRMQTVIGDLADVVGSELGRAKARIVEGRRQVEQLVASKPAALQRVAREAAAEFSREFDTLTRVVEEKQQSLVDDLATRYVAARGAIDAEIERLQQENEGLWGKAKEAVAGTVRTIMQLKDMLTGVLARAAGAVELIIKAPVRFLGNLVNAVKGGVVAFGNNIWTHLKAGLKAWLLGSLADAGLEIPERFDLMGILRLVLSVLGLTWAKIRSRIVQVVTEPVMRRLEQTVEIVQVLVTEGLPGLWRWVLRKVGDIKEMVLGQIKSFVVEKVVKAGIVWLVSMLNPASAFIKACKAIYDIVMFFVQRGSQIKSFVDSVLDSIGAIARGGGGAVVGIVENALARALPVVIGFLASLLNLGGIPDKLRSIIDTVRAPVTDAVDWVAGMVVKAGKSLMSHLQGDDDRSPEERKAALDTAMADGQTALTERGLTASGIRSRLATIRQSHRVKKLDLVVEARTAESETVHIVGANSPTVHGPTVTRPLLATQRAELTAAGPPTTLTTSEAEQLRAEITAILRESPPPGRTGVPLLRPGQFAGAHQLPGKPWHWFEDYFDEGSKENKKRPTTGPERRAMQDITLCCHSCGKVENIHKGRKYNWTVDHQPPSGLLNVYPHPTLVDHGIDLIQRTYPQCKECSDAQRDVVRDANRLFHRLNKIEPGWWTNT